MPQYDLIEDGHHYMTVEASDIAAALERAEAEHDSYAYDASAGTVWVDIVARLAESESCADECAAGMCGTCHPEEISTTTPIDPPVPDCPAGDYGDHEWCAPHDVVGGCQENPGVQGHGGGVIIREVCGRCGTYRIRDTWAQRTDTGEQGLESLRYEAPDNISEGWIEVGR